MAKGLKGLNTVQGQQAELKRLGYTDIPRESYTSYRRRLDLMTPARQEVGMMTPENFGESSYDKDVKTWEELNNLQDLRAESQPWYSKLGADLVKGIGLAGTTWADGTVGLMCGISQGILNLTDNDPNTGFWQGLWNNEVSLAMNDLNKKMEEWLPNYYSTKEQEMNVLEKLGTFNFWSDGLLKNLGFVVGAAYSGGAINKVLKAFHLLNTKLAAGIVGSVVSGVNEGRVEATQLYKDTLNMSNLQIDDQYNKRRQEILESDLSSTEKVKYLTHLNSTTEALRQDAENRANNAAGVDLLANSILLPFDNFITYGKLFGRGFKDTKNLVSGNTKRTLRQRVKDATKSVDDQLATDLAENAGREGSEYLWKDITKKEILKKGAKTALREGNEEMAQQFFSSTAGYMYQPESPDTYYKAMINGRTQAKSQDIITSMVKGFADSYGDGSQYEQFVVGALTGLLGMPTFGKVNNSGSDTYLGRGKAIGLTGGIFGEYTNAKDINRRGQAAVNDINKTIKKLSDSKTSLAMSIGFNNDMEGYAKDNDKFEYLNAADNDLFRLFSRFVSIGREEDFREIVDRDFDNLPDDELEKIAGFTAHTPDVLNYSDGFRNDDGTLMSSTEEGRKKMREKLNERKQHLLKQMESYKDALGYVRGETNNTLSPDQEDELAWLLWKTRRFDERAEEIKDRYGDGLDAIMEAINIRKTEVEADLRAKEQKKDISEKAVLNTIETDDIIPIQGQLNEAKESIKELNKELNNYRLLSNILGLIKSGSRLSGLILSDIVVEKDDEKKTSLSEILLSEDFYKNFVKTGKDYTRYKDGLTAVLDTVKLSKSRDLFNERLAEYMGNLGRLSENRAKLDKVEDNKAKDINSIKAKDRVAKATVSDLNNLDEDDFSELEALLDDEEYSEELAKIQAAKEVKGAKKGIEKAIDDMASSGEVPLETAQDAVSLLNLNSMGANSIDELEDLDSEAILAATIDMSDFEEILKQATEDGTKSVEESLAELKAEKERRKDAAMTVLANSIRIAKDAREETKSIPQEAPSVVDGGNTPGKDTGSAPAIPVTPSATPSPVTAKKEDNDIVNYISDLASKGYSAKDIFDGVKDLPAYKEAIDAGFTEEDIKQEINRAIAANAKKEKDKSKPGESHKDNSISVDSDDVSDDDSESFDSASFDFEKVIDSENSSSQEQGSKPINGTYTYWKPATTEFKIHRSRGDNSPYYQSANADAATKSRYEAVWKFLKRLNAFERVKTLKNGDVVHFGISKELSQSTGIPVLLILNENNEVLGDLPVQSDRTFTAYPGLDDAYKVATAYYNEHKNDSSDDIVVITDIKSTVNAKLIGKPQYTSRDDRRTLNKINTVEQADGSRKSVPFKLGVAISSGSNPRIMVTPGRRKSQSQTAEEIAVQRPIRATEGQPFMLMETSKQRGGTNEKVKVCVPINMPKFSITNPQVANSELGKIIQEKLAEITSLEGNKDSILRWIREVKELLALESLHVDFIPGSFSLEGRLPSKIVLTMKRWGEPRTLLYQGPQKSEHIVTAIINNLSKNGGTQINVSRKYINGKYGSYDYNTIIGALATTNLPEGATHTINDWFSINPIVEGKEQKGKGPVSIGENLYSSEGIFLLTIDGTTWGLGDDNKIYGERNGQYIEVQASDEFKAYMHGRKYNLPMNRPYNTPWGYYNPLTQKFEAQNTEAMNSKKAELSDILATQSSRISFNAETHTYTVDGKKTDTSVTQYIHRNDAKEEEKDPVLGFFEISSKLGNTIDSLARSFFNGERVVKPKNMTDKQFSRVLAHLMMLKDQITETVGTGWIAITDERLLRVAGTIDGITVGGTLDMLIREKSGKYRVIDFKTKRVSDAGVWSLEGRTLEQYEQQVLVYQKLLEDMYPQFKGQFNLPIIAAFSTKYQRPKGSRKYETGDAVYTEDNGAILVNGNPIELSKGYDPGSFKGIAEVRKSTTIPSTVGIEPVEVGPSEASTLNNPAAQSESNGRKSQESPVGSHTGKAAEKKVEEPAKKPEERPQSKPSKKEVQAKTKEQSIADIKAKGLLPSNKPERLALLSVLDKDSLSELSELPKMKLKTILDRVAVKYRQNMSYEEIVSLFNEAGYKGLPPFRKVNDDVDDVSVWDKDKEMARASQMLPQLSEEGRVRLVDGLIKISDSRNPGYAWGMLKNGTLVLSDRAARGTLYHEAFHFISQILMSRAERARLYTAAALRYGAKSDMELEELLAEDFRKYTQSIEDTEVKQMNFIQRMFSSIRDIIKGIFGKTIELDQLFSEINRGRYARRRARVSVDTSYRETGFSKEMQSIKEKAIADGTFMKAPNGKPTNLNERQWLQVRTKAFKDWFGDWENNPKEASKVVDENGEPLVVYHGSKDNSFTIFDSTKNDKGQKGFFFTNDRTMASSYGKNPRGFFINSRNPYIIEGHNNNWNNLIVGVTDIAKDKLDSIRLFRNDLLLQLKEGETSKEIYDYWNNKYFKLYDKYLSLSNSFIDKIKKIAILNRLNKFEGKGNFLKSTRYTERVLELDNEDVNIIFTSITDYGPVFNKEASVNMINNVAANVYVVTKPNNIKSATSNTGEFSTTNDDIRYRLVGQKGAAKYDKIHGSSFMYSLSIAKAMEREGKSPEAIKWATGWERGAEDKWRLERPDVKFVSSLKVKVTDGKAVVPLTDIIKDKELLEMYPDMAKVTITFSKLKGGISGSTDREGNINLGIDNLIGSNFNQVEYDRLVAEENRLMATSEFQEYYDFYNSNPSEEVIAEYIRTHPIAQQLEEVTDRRIELGNARRDVKDGTLSVDISDKLKDTIVHELQHIIQDNEEFIAGSNSNDTIYDDKYWRVSGEVEARNVSRRRKLSWVDRLKSTAASTEDVRRGKQLYGSRWLVLESDIRNELIARGWTQERFNSVSALEREQAIQEAKESIDTLFRSHSNKIRQYHREKFMYGNLSQEEKDYLDLRGISIQDYNRMSSVEKEVLFHCMS